MAEPLVPFEALREDAMLKRVVLCIAVAMFATVLGGGPLAAQQSDQPQPIKRTILQKSDVPGTNYETVLGIAEIAPNAEFARHTHPGTESSYVVEGSLTLNVEDQPTRSVQTGESIFVPAGIVHSGRAGPAGAKILAAWVVEKGKPLASPAK
jgi:quercetin dioxygenase-like cupin family protein